MDEARGFLISSIDLKDKVAIVTGASRGIGKGVAIALAREGVHVVVAARSEERRRLPGTIVETVDEIKAMGLNALPVRCDVRDEQSIEETVNKTLGEFGRVDILVNNAAVGTYDPFLELPVKLWDLVMAVNLRGPFLFSRAVLPSMISQGWGSIVNLSSLGADQLTSTAFATDPEAPPTIVGQAYGVSKSALERMSRGLAAEMGRHNIAVNAVKPSRPVLTEGFQFQRPDADYSLWGYVRVLGESGCVPSPPGCIGGDRSCHHRPGPDPGPRPLEEIHRRAPAL